MRAISKINRLEMTKNGKLQGAWKKVKLFLWYKWISTSLLYSVYHIDSNNACKLSYRKTNHPTEKLKCLSKSELLTSKDTFGSQKYRALIKFSYI